MHDMLIILVVSLITIIIRALPFIIFKDKDYPIINYLAQVLPYSIMAMLVVYCLKSVNILTGNHGICEIIGCTSVILLHLYKRNNLISILGGTLIYMVCLHLL